MKRNEENLASSVLENFRIMPRGISIKETIELIYHLPARTTDALHEAGVPLWAGVELARLICIDRGVPASTLKEALAGCPALEAELDRITEEPIEHVSPDFSAWARERCEVGEYISRDLPPSVGDAIDWDKVAAEMLKNYYVVRENDAMREVYEARPGVDKDASPSLAYLFWRY